MRRLFGPSTLITAAFIGPGTVTVCTLAGVQSGYSLLWALLFSVAVTLVLQEMTGRLGLITQQGFGEALRQEITHPGLRVAMITLVLGAIVIGNAAYEGGNISGAALGLEALSFSATLELGPVRLRLAPLLIGGAAFLILWSGRFRIIERSLLALVAVMSLVFVGTALLVKPDPLAIARGLLPGAGETDWLLVVALLGTTVVPYNLFLHASLVRERYHNPDELNDLRGELAVAILLGGVISMSIVITSATTLYLATDIESAADMAPQLEPLLGSWAGAFLGIGLFAAGISSAITAPLAAAYAARGVLGWSSVVNNKGAGDSGMGTPRFRFTWQFILLLGVLVSSTGLRPVSIIQFAQVANGILLPVVAGMLLLLMNRRRLLGNYCNSGSQNVLAGVILLITVILGLRSILSVF